METTQSCVEGMSKKVRGQECFSDAASARLSSIVSTNASTSPRQSNPPRVAHEGMPGNHVLE